MEIEKGRIINNFFGEGKKRYSIPVYQRNYEWSTEQCRQLFDDIVEPRSGIENILLAR